jgi:EmrB/QacA subfamily drug resistance transporter
MLTRNGQTPGEVAPGAAHRWWALAAVECGNFVVYMDGFVVTLALPALARQFGVALPVLKWVTIAYLLTVTVTLLPAGRLADIWGRKRIVVLGLAVLAVSALLCALAPNVEMLIACRVLQGIGGGLVLANVMAEITAVFPIHERPKAMGVNVSVLGVAQVTGLVLGGLLIDQFGWRSLFVIVLAVSLLGLILSLVILQPGPRAIGRASLDWTGAVLAVGAVGAPFLFIEQFSGELLNPTSLAVLAGGVAVLGLFLIVEARAPRPLLHLRLFRSWGFACGSVAAAFYFISAVSCYFLLPLYAQVVLGLTAVRAGLLVVPLSLVMTASGLTVGRLGGRLAARTVSTAGMLCVSDALLGLSFLGPRASYAEIVWPLVVLGTASGLFHPANNCATLSTVPPEHLGVANGFFETARNFGLALGAALAATLLARGLGPAGSGEALAGPAGAQLGGRHLDSFLAAQHFAFRLAAALGLVGALISVLRGAEIPLAPPASQHSAEQVRDGHEVGRTNGAEQRVATDCSSIG